MRACSAFLKPVSIVESAIPTRTFLSPVSCILVLLVSIDVSGLLFIFTNLPGTVAVTESFASLKDRLSRRQRSYLSPPKSQGFPVRSFPFGA